MTSPLKIGLIPLDERPVNTRYPRMIAQIAEAEVILPPKLSQFRQAAPVDELLAWLDDTAPSLGGLVVSLEMLVYGGLIASRIGQEPADLLLSRLEALRTLRQKYPHLKIYGFNLITRISRHDDSTEEPLYWAEYGARMFRFSQLMDQAAQGMDVGGELESLQAAIPAEHRDDFLNRRARNHKVNRRALELLAEGVFDLLVLSSDDTSPYGLGSSEKRALTAYAQKLGLGDNLLMYPGADEVGCVLVARMARALAGADTPPRFQARYLIPGGEAITAPFEDGPIQTSVERQIRAAGGILSEESPDWVLYVNPPLESEAEWPRPYTPDETAARLPQFKLALDSWPGGEVLIADLAHANGADRAFFDFLQTFGLVGPGRACYAAWNTAGNSLGTLIAYGVAKLAGGEGGEFCAHRLIEDWAYQLIVREQARDWLEDQTGRRDPGPEGVAMTAAWIEARLMAFCAENLAPLAYRIRAGSLRLPWGRTFEIDFDLEPNPHA